MLMNEIKQLELEINNTRHLVISASLHFDSD